MPRERLFAALDGADGERCLWVSAPGGAGKTSLVSSWVEARNLSCIWYQVDAGDADPATFFHYLRLAAQSAAGHRRVGLPHLTPEYLPALDVFVRRFFERFFACFKPPFLLALDDYQEVAPEEPLHAVLSGALHALPPGGRLIFLSREEPPATALARWCAASGFRRLGWDELRFSDEEAQALACLAGAPEEEAVCALNSQARGWAAGLMLLLRARAAGVEGGPASGETPGVLFDYFAVEVFNHLRPAVRDFLIQTTLLPHVTAEAARELSGQEEAADTLAWLHRSRLFTDRRAQEGAAASYQYHPLFREFLLARARAALTASDLAELQRRAARLLEAAGEPDAAAALSLAAQDWPALQRLVRRHGPALMAQGRTATLEDWILPIPAALREGDAWLAYWLGVASSFRDPPLGRGSLEQAYRRFRAEGDMAGAFLAVGHLIGSFFLAWVGDAPLDGWIAEFQTLLSASGGVIPAAAEAHVLGWCHGVLFRRPDDPMVPPLAERALGLAQSLPEADQRSALAGFGLHYLLWTGQVSRARAFCDELLASLGGAGSAWPRINFDILRGMVLWQEAEHEAANAVLQEALVRGERAGLHISDAQIYQQLAFSALSAGDIEAAEEALDAGWPLLEPWRVTHIQSYRFLRAAVLLRKGRTAEAVTLARATAESGMGLGSPFLDAIGHTLLGNLLMLDGQHAEARAHLQWALDLGRRMPSDNLKFQSLMPLAWCHLDAGEDEAGLACLREALAIGRRHSYKNCDPWWIPQVMSRLCARALDAGIEPDYVRRLIRLRGLAPPADCLDLEGWPWGVRIYTLGRFAVFIEGEPLRFSTKAQKRPLELLKALIALGGRGIGMEPLADQLWPSFEGDAGQNALQVALHRLRKLLGDKEVLDLQEGRLSFDPARLWVDAWAFERLTGKADTLVRARPKESAGRAPALAEALLGLYLGPFLHEEEAPWAIGQRERLHSKFLRTASALCALLEGAGQLAQAADMHRRALEVDPLAEEAHRGLMRCLQSAGRIAEALDAYRRCRHILSVTLGIAPSPETQALYRALKG